MQGVAAVHVKVRLVLVMPDAVRLPTAPGKPSQGRDEEEVEVVRDDEDEVLLLVDDELDVLLEDDEDVEARPSREP